MNLNSITAGLAVPDDIHVIIEIPANSNPIKYEIDKETNALFVDRFMSTPMFYPANYGYIPQTLADDGDPLDVLVITPYPVEAGAVINCRPIGMLNMSDESGQDEKIIAVPSNKLTTLYKDILEYNDLPELQLKQIQHFFEHYKDLEEGKWVKVDRWQDKQAAHEVIVNSINAYNK